MSKINIEVFVSDKEILDFSKTTINLHLHNGKDKSLLLPRLINGKGIIKIAAAYNLESNKYIGACFEFSNNLVMTYVQKDYRKSGVGLELYKYLLKENPSLYICIDGLFSYKNKIKERQNYLLKLGIKSLPHQIFLTRLLNEEIETVLGITPQNLDDLTITLLELIKNRPFSLEVVTQHNYYLKIKKKNYFDLYSICFDNNKINIFLISTNNKNNRIKWRYSKTFHYTKEFIKRLLRFYIEDEILIAKTRSYLITTKPRKLNEL